MPGFDGNGPYGGNGPRTGRRLGPCDPNNSDINSNIPIRPRWGMRFGGRGRGFGRRFNQQDYQINKEIYNASK